MLRPLAALLVALVALLQPATLLAETNTLRVAPLTREAGPGAPDASPDADVADTSDPDSAETQAAGDTGDGKLDVLRVSAGFLVTTGIRYMVGGLAHSPFLIQALASTPGVGIAAMIGVSLVEAGLSIAAFQAIAGIESNKHLIAAFLLSAAASTLLAPLLLGAIGPVGGLVAALGTNAIRLALFNLIARKEGEPLDLTDLTISPLTALAADGETDEKSAPEAVVAPDPRALASLDGTLADLGRLVQERYKILVEAPGALDSEAFQDYLAAKQSYDAAIQAAASR